MTVLLSAAAGSVSAGAERAGFGPAVGSYLCDTQACAPGCPGEQSPWSEQTITASVPVSVDRAGEAQRRVGGRAAPDHAGRPVLGWALSWGHCPPPALRCPGPALAWPWWASVGGLGRSNGASTARDRIFSKLIEVNSRIMLVGFMLWPPKERRLQFLVFLVFPGLNQHKSLPQRPRGEGRGGRS